MNKNISNKKVYCYNCNSNYHEYKDCPEPIISWGIILVNLTDIPIEIKHNKINIRSHIYNITPTSQNELHILSQTMSLIKFLLVQRKHSLGYVDFIRGKYKLDNIDGINFLFQHMNREEINKIKNLDFDELWKDLWNNDETKINNIQKEYTNAKQKFENLKTNNEIELNLDFYIENVEPIYKSNEWGFPKGRKSKNENSRDCALREFSEETNIPMNKINLIDEIEPIEENLIGTNGIKYRHIYYIAEIKENYLPSIDGNNEIGGMDYFSYNDGLSIIREYHIDKKNVLTSVFYYYLETITNNINSSNHIQEIV
jgi:8-oxo-dGTP pyrophosphatase MutT (NUDIX family)